MSSRIFDSTSGPFSLHGIAAAVTAASPAIALAAEAGGSGGGAPGGPAGLPLNPLWMILFFISIAAWLYAVQWVYDDAQGVDAGARKWASAMVAAGFVGVLLSLFLHAAISAFTLACVIGVFAWYVSERNKVVPTMHRLFGEEHRRQIKQSLVFWQSGGPAEAELEGIPLSREDGATMQQLVTREPELAEPASALTRWMTDAVRLHGTELNILPTGDGMAARLTLDGVPQTLETTDPDLGRDLLRVVNWLTTSDGENQKSGGRGFYAQLPGDDKVRITARPVKTKAGRGARLKLPDQSSEELHDNPLDVLGMDDDMVEQVEELLDSRKKALLVTGPEDSGVTTTLRATMKHVDLFVTSVVALEEDGEHNLMQVSQMQLDPSSGEDFETVYKRALRDEPEMIMVDTLEHSERLEPLFQFAAEDGTLLAPLRVDRSTKAILELLRRGLKPTLLYNGLGAVLNQRLIRKLCPDCREEVEVTPRMRKRLKIGPEEPVTLYKPVGCGNCLETGYRGRTAIFELMHFTGGIKELVKKAASGNAKLSSKALKKAADKETLHTLEESGIQKVKEGITTMQELRRVLGGSGSKTSAKSKKNN